MSEAVSALNGASFDGIARIEETGLQGMVSLRGDLASDALRKAVEAATGAPVPDQGRVSEAGGNWVAWMSPDELLLVVAHDAAPAITAQLGEALSGTHHLVVDVSDARAMFRLTGDAPRLREAIAKLCPVDMAPGAFGPGQFRRTRMAQIPAAIWMPTADSVQVICFRSVADYAFKLLQGAVAPGSAVGAFS